MSVSRGMRQSQTIVPFGVGAILDLQGESFCLSGLAKWGPHGERLVLSRLSEDLGVDHFRAAPAKPSHGWGPGVPAVRFPRWLFCPRCRTMVFWKTEFEQDGEIARCKRAKCRSAPLVPMRFVALCPDGHMTDVPWLEWVHSHAKQPSQKQCHSKNLALLTNKDAPPGLAALSVYCRECKARRSLEGLTRTDSLKALPGRHASVMCPGTQPWERADQGGECTHVLQVVQRGATNLHFPRTQTALDIPPWSDYDPDSELTDAIRCHPNFAAIISAPNGPVSQGNASGIASDLGCDVDHVWAAVRDEVPSEAGDAEHADIRGGEWAAFQGPPREFDERSTFILADEGFSAAPDLCAGASVLGELVGSVRLALKLREVRALTSFTRYSPSGHPVDIGSFVDWLPAIEVFGEGIFIALHEGRVASWESRSEVVKRAQIAERRRGDDLVGSRFEAAASPRFIMLHTFAHLLIRELVLECGYASSSLRERIYAQAPDGGGPAQAGILIYTAAGDAEGTLGGLVDQGRSPRLASVILRALERSAWCSSDPLCRENPGQGLGSLNRAACHACTLLPETSCEWANRLLDRTMVCGDPHVPGFFSEVLDDLTSLDEAGEGA